MRRARGLQAVFLGGVFVGAALQGLAWAQSGSDARPSPSRPLRVGVKI